MPQHQIIPPVLANPCLDLFEATYRECPDPAIRNGYTHTCSFNAQELQHWIAEVVNLTKCENIELRLAVYTQDVVNAYPEQLAGKEGRLTVFLYPSTSDNQSSTSNPPEGAFNLGTNEP